MKKILTISIFFIFYALGLCGQIDEADNAWLSGNFESAEIKYTDLINQTPSDIAPFLNLAHIYRAKCEYQNAINIYKKALTLSSNNNDSLAYIYTALGESYYYNNGLKKAKKFFNDALEIAPANFHANFGLARTLYEQNKLKQAETIFNNLTEQNKNFSGLYYYLAKIYEKYHNLEKAAEYYSKCVTKDNHFVEANLPLGQNYLERKLYESAYKQFYKLANIDKDNTFVIAEIEKVKPYLTRSDEEIIPKRNQKDFLKFKTSPQKDIPLVRIGLNSDNRGDLIPVSEITIKSNLDFNLIQNNNILLSGKAGRHYSIIYKEGTILIKDKLSNKTLLDLKNAFTLKPKKLAYNSFIIENIEFARGYPWAGKEDRQYRGQLEVNPDKDGLILINQVNIEEYLYSVLPSEMPSNWPAEALKAQAIIARSYLLHRKKYFLGHKKNGYDLCDGQHCQVYSGIYSENTNSNKAVDDTRKKALRYNNTVVNALFHSNCGGHTQSSNELEGWGNVSYLTGVFDGKEGALAPYSPLTFEVWLKNYPKIYCAYPEGSNNPSVRWFRIVPADIIQEKVDRIKQIGSIEKIFASKRSDSGHVNELIIYGKKDTLKITLEYRIRRILGLGPLRSTLFWIETKLKSGKPYEFVIYGGGWGHGVGMCQTGAAGMAKEGKTCEEILKHYYKGAKITE
ncbi:MAG: SpoIID/LytB domain-containing protein [Elusimicrobiota bacterium]